MNDPLSRIYDSEMRRFAELAANAKYNVYRPDYASATTVETSVKLNTPARVDPSNSWPEPLYPCDNFSVFIDRRGIQPGDVLIPNPNDNITRHTVTILNVDSKKEMNAFATDRIGTLTTSRKKPVYENVRFSVFGTPGSTSELNSDMEGSLPMGVTYAALWWRRGLAIGMHFIESPVDMDGEPLGQDNVWQIEQITGTYPLALLTLVKGR